MIEYEAQRLGRLALERRPLSDSSETEVTFQQSAHAKIDSRHEDHRF